MARRFTRIRRLRARLAGYPDRPFLLLPGQAGRARHRAADPDPAMETDLLLCGHHYRVSRGSLAAAHTTVREIPGTLNDTAAWIELGQHDPLIPASPVS
jgi:hypothetical protein